MMVVTAYKCYTKCLYILMQITRVKVVIQWYIHFFKLIVLKCVLTVPVHNHHIYHMVFFPVTNGGSVYKRGSV